MGESQLHDQIAVFRAPSVEEAAKMLGYSKVIKGEEVIGLW